MLERLVSSVEQQQRHMTSSGLLQVHSMSGEEDPGTRVCLTREELQRLSRRAQLWPLTEDLAVLNQLRLSTDLLQLALSPGYKETKPKHIWTFILTTVPFMNSSCGLAVTRRLRRAYGGNFPDISATASSPPR